MKTILAVLLFGFAAQSFADEYVPGYTKRDGTYVPSYHRTAPDNSRKNNYDSRGNTNPWTGKQGTVNPNTPSGSRYRSDRGY